MVKHQLQKSGTGSYGDVDDMAQTTSIKRPFQKLYKEFKLLNAFAIINDVAIQELLKDFDKTFFLSEDCQILRHNIDLMINEMHFKKDKKILFRLSEDLTVFYSQLFTNGNRKKAVKELDVRPAISL